MLGRPTARHKDLESMSTREVLIALAHALVGWGLCGATMGISLAKMSLTQALAIHAVAAPIIFAAVSAVYFAYFAYSSPLTTALGFVVIVIVMDFFVVALLIQRDLTMFKNMRGTWLPFGLILLATYVVGLVAQ